MSLLKISRGLKFKLSSHGEPCACIHTLVEAFFYGREREDRRVIVNSESMSLHWLSFFVRKEKSFLFLLDSTVMGGHENFMRMPSNFILTFCLLIFIKPNIAKDIILTHLYNREYL